MKNILLIGMPGSGKSTLGQQLAQELGRSFYDADSVLEEREQRSIKSFFAESEEAFRQAETRTLRYLAQLEGVVIASGGGAVTRPENMLLFQGEALIVFLDRSPVDILGDIQGDERPLLADDKQRLYKLYEERLPLYRKYAGLIVDNGGSQHAALEKLLQGVLHYEGK